MMTKPHYYKPFMDKPRVLSYKTGTLPRNPLCNSRDKKYTGKNTLIIKLFLKKTYPRLKKFFILEK